MAGGGTAGHVQPGLALAQALVARGHPAASLHFVGSRRGIEASMVPEAGFPLTLLPGRGIARRLSVQSAVSAGALLVACARAVALVGRHRPRVVVALGGYAAVPCALAAALWRVPIVVMEQNAVPGAANRLVGRFARACAVSFEGTALPRAVVTGNPVRPEILAVDRDGGRTRAATLLGLPDGRRVVAVFGGSLGARRLNEAVLAAGSRWRDRSDLAVHHVVGDRDWATVQEHLATQEPPAAQEHPPAGARQADRQDGFQTAPGLGGLVYSAVRYEHRMDQLLAAADVAVCRAGATSVAELAAVGLPSVLVPLPGAPGDHQTANARALAATGGALVVPDAELDGRRLAEVVDALLADPARLASMAAAARAWSRRDAAERVADLVEHHAGTEAGRRP